jgi:hypothetical protein
VIPDSRPKYIIFHGVTEQFVCSAGSPETRIEYFFQTKCCGCNQHTVNTSIIGICQNCVSSNIININLSIQKLNGDCIDIVKDTHIDVVV